MAVLQLFGFHLVRSVSFLLLFFPFCVFFIYLSFFADDEEINNQTE